MNVSSVNHSIWTPAAAPMSTAPTVGGATFSAALSSTAKTAVADPLADHLFTHDDPLNQYLTSGDRAMFKSLYGVDFAVDGGIMSPPSLTPNEYASIRAAAGQIATDRAAGLTPTALPSLPDGSADLEPTAKALAAAGFGGTTRLASVNTAPVTADFVKQMVSDFMARFEANQPIVNGITS